MTDQKLRVGVLGAGWWAASNHLPVLKERSDVVITAVCRKGSDALEVVRSAFDVPFATEDENEFLNHDELDAVVISTPHQQHADQAVAAIERGLHVLVEKPIAVDRPAADRILAAAQAHECVVLVPYGWNFSRIASTAVGWLRSGRIGTVRHVAAQMASPMGDILSGRSYTGTEGDLFQPDPRTWSDPATGGYGWGQLVHLLGLIFLVLPSRPVEVFGFTDATADRCDLFNAAVVKLDDGADMSISGAGTLPAGAKFQVDIRIFGTDGCIMLDVERERACLWSNNGDKEELALSPGEGDYSCDAPVHRFIDLCVGRRVENPGSVEIAAAGVDVVAALHESARTRLPISIPPRDGASQ